MLVGIADVGVVLAGHSGRRIGRGAVGSAFSSGLAGLILRGAALVSLAAALFGLR
jgi:hypothetical protein